MKEKNKLDKIVFGIIRSRGACERCGSKITLQVAHVKSRKYNITRWAPVNLYCLCARCHRYFHDNPDEWGGFIGVERLIKLHKIFNSRFVFKPIHIKEFLEEVEKIDYYTAWRSFEDRHSIID